MQLRQLPNQTNIPKTQNDNACAEMDANIIKEYIEPLFCTISGLSIILHSYGIYLLFKVKHVKANQRILLTNLSLSEILFAIFNVLINALNLAEDEMDILDRLEWFFFYVYLVSPSIITVDRLIAGTVPLRYKSICSVNKTIAAVISVWSCMLMIFMPIIFIYHKVECSGKLADTALGIKIAVVTFAIVSYTSIGIKVYKQRELFARTNTSSRTMKVAILIIVTYFVFEVATGMLHVIWKDTHLNELTDNFEWASLLGQLNIISDPIIYLYYYPPLRSAVKEQFQLIMKRLGCNKKEVMAVEHPADRDANQHL